MNKKHLALIVVIVLVVAGAVGAAIWKYNQTNHVSYAQLQSQNAGLKKQVSTLKAENATLNSGLTLTKTTNQKLTTDKAQLCVQVKLARLPSVVCQ